MSDEANKQSIADANKAKEELDNATAALEAAKQQLKDGKARKNGITIVHITIILCAHSSLLTHYFLLSSRGTSCHG